jgi:hypothetical protein
MSTTPICYEDFGAVGDGVADDLPAICAAHAHANSHRLPVRSQPDATYHLGRQALTAVIATDTDWSTSRFTIDDTAVDDHQASLFAVRSLLPTVELPITALTRDQRAVDIQPEHDCHVLVENDQKRVYIRRGLNQNAGVPQRDCFILRRDGSIEGDIDWHYDTISHIEARAIDDTPLVVRGGVFTTFANCMVQEVGYNYWGRNIDICRSNTVIDGLTHYVVGETAVGHPYRGFLAAHHCADIAFRNCFATGHKIYSTIGAAGKPVSMGSYDLHANDVVNFRMQHCRMNHVTDRTRWGVIGTNFCKNILLEDCTLSRMDTHMGVSGSYTIRGCTLGHMGLNAIGRGVMSVEDCTLHGRALVRFRSDYGSTWDGELVIRNSRWIPACGDEAWPCLIDVANDGMHDFGYPCSMPHTVTIAHVEVDDSNHPTDYTGMYIFSDPDRMDASEAAAAARRRPHPYQLCQQLVLTELVTASGLSPAISPNDTLAEAATLSPCG